MILCAPQASALQISQVIEEYFRTQVAKTDVPGAALIVTNAEQTQVSLVTRNYPSADSPQIIGSTTATGSTWQMVQLFLPDAFWVMVVSASGLLAGGALKAVDRLRCPQG